MSTLTTSTTTEPVADSVDRIGSLRTEIDACDA
jgi:hypothetical protein